MPRVLAFEHRHVKNQHQEVAAFFVTEYHKMRVVSLIRKLEHKFLLLTHAAAWKRFCLQSSRARYGGGLLAVAGAVQHQNPIQSLI